MQEVLLKIIRFCNSCIIFYINQRMNPKRPDSAKSYRTRLTIDSETSKKELNSSIFSETLPSGALLHQEKKDKDFKQYVAEKDQDPKFKHLKPKLQQIPEKAPKAKVNAKPFGKRRDSQNVDKKYQTSKKEEEEFQKNDSKLSKGYPDKMKAKLISQKTSTNTQGNKVIESNEKAKTKPNFEAFKVNYPNKKREKSKIEEKSQNKTNSHQNNKQSPEKIQKKQPTQSQKRQQQFRQLQNFLNVIQSKNIEQFPPQYDRYVQTLENEDLDKINIEQYMNQPTEGDYDMLMKKIKKFDQEIDKEDQEEEETTSIKEQTINLDDIIEDSQDEQSYMSQISCEDLKKRNVFLTEILKGKISKDQIDELEEMDKSSVKFYKLTQFSNADRKEEEQPKVVNMVKNKSNRLMEKNKIEAAGQLYRDCDYLSVEQQQRIEELLNGPLEPSPFEYNELQRMRNRGMDEGIRMYRQLSQSIQNCEEDDLLLQSTLPKDPSLRKQAEKKLIQDKIKSVNQRLMSLEKVQVSKTKIQEIVKKYEDTKISSMTQSLLNDKRKQFEEEMSNIKNARQILQTLGNKQTMSELMNDLQSESQRLQNELKKSKKIDAKQLKRRQVQKLNNHKVDIAHIQQLSKQIEKDIEGMNSIKNELQNELIKYEEFQNMQTRETICQQDYERETIEDIEQKINEAFDRHPQRLEGQIDE